jgi:hypothetical protein
LPAALRSSCYLRTLLNLYRLSVKTAGRFKEAFLLDCDVILRRDPAFMFDAPLFRERGNYFWGDIYGVGMVKDEVFKYVGEL